MRTLALGKVFHLIEPGPVLMMSTAGKERPNLMTLSWHMMLEFNPPLIACCLGGWDYSLEALRRDRACVLAVPTVDLAAKVVDIGNCSGRDLDKFRHFKLTPRPAKKVAAPLVEECLANLECRLVDTSLANKYGLHVLEVVHAWSNPARKERRLFHANGDGTFCADGRVLDLRKRMVKWKDIL